MTWSDIKEVFYAVGAIAGVIALLRPVIESKFQRDQERLTGVRKLVNEIGLVNLVSRIDNQRQVPDKEFEPFRVLAYDRSHNLESLRFSGPLAKHFLHEVDAIIAAYEDLRGYIQVDEWEPTNRKAEDGTEYTVWVFNKSAGAFKGADGVPRNYAQHLTEAAAKADEIRRAFQRLQLVSELHFFEVPFAKKLLKRRFEANNL
jgi:hypothetical protein